MKIIISGGGTGGHIFPAVAIANEIKHREPNVEILFVGAEGKMEMEKVPKAGYQIIGLPVAGFNRSNILANLSFPIKLIKSLWKAKGIIKSFNPDITIGVGGFASGPTLAMANFSGKHTLIQEQNSFAGVTNKILSKKAKKVCVAYPNMEQFFPAEKIIFTGNPVRSDLLNAKESLSESRAYFKLNADQKTLLVIGGSLGAKSINMALKQNLKKLVDNGIQVIWQTGKDFLPQALEEIKSLGTTSVYASDFIYEMGMAYKSADLVLSRAGALSVSELSLLAKAAILVPYPHAAEDHQTANAMALKNEKAAILIPDHEIGNLLGETVLELFKDDYKAHQLSLNIAKFAKPNAAKEIVDEIFKIIKK